MTGIAFAELTAEIEAAVRDGTAVRRARILRQIAAFFLAMSDRLSVAQLSIFDDVLLRLTQRAEPRLLAELSTALAEVSVAPQQTVRRLAFHESPDVAGPLLAKSNALPDT